MVLSSDTALHGRDRSLGNIGVPTVKKFEKLGNEFNCNKKFGGHPYYTMRIEVMVRISTNCSDTINCQGATEAYSPGPG